MSDLRLYLFECGTLKCKLHNIKMNQGLNEPYEIPVPWFFIQHPKGNIVIDGGNALECANDPHRPTRGVRVRLHSRLVCGRRLCPARFRSTGPALAFPRGTVHGQLRFVRRWLGENDLYPGPFTRSSIVSNYPTYNGFDYSDY